MPSFMNGPPLSRPGSRWWALVVAFATAIVLTAWQQLHFGIRDAREQAREDAVSILAFLQGQTDPIDVERLTHVASRFEHVQWAAYCRDAACAVQYQQLPEVVSCPVFVAQPSVCVTSGDEAAGPYIILRYSIAETLFATLRDLGFMVLFGGVGIVTWAAASRRYRQRIQAGELMLRHSATHDALTGLWNRSAFEAALARRVVAVLSGEPVSALLYLDLDGFKDVNDTHGHTTGDVLLAAVAKRLESAAEDGIVIGRLGGDEFGVLLPRAESALEAEAVAKQLLALMAAPFTVGDAATLLGVSIGIAMLDGTTHDAEEALRRADLALYDVKRTHPGHIQHYDEALSLEVRARYHMVADLRVAIAHSQLFLEYQPQVNKAGRLHGVEALVRWQHPQKGLIRPDAFIPLAEQTGLIVPLGQSVIEMACADLQQFRAGGLRLPYVSINVSPKQLAEKDFISQLQMAMSRRGLGPRDLELEVTESALTDADGQQHQLLSQLSARGFRLAIDDFGTGYSSLSRLQSLPIDKLKIDRAFVAAIDAENGSSVLAETIIAMAAKLHLRTVAEGVETEAQAEWLRDAGCQLMQGYLFARPMRPALLIAWASDRNTSPPLGTAVWRDTATLD